MSQVLLVSGTPCTSMQQGGDREREHGQCECGRERDRDNQHRSSHLEVDPNRITDQLLVQAERFKAKVEAPKGMSELLMPYDYDKLRSKFVRPEGLALIDNEILFLCNFDQDDEFFPRYQSDRTSTS